MNQPKNDALKAAMNFTNVVGAKQKNFELESEDGTKKLVSIDKWTVTEQLQFLPTFGMLFSPIIEKFTNIMFSSSGKNNAGDVFGEDSVSVESLLSQNSVFMFFQFLASEGNMQAILNMILKNVSVQGQKADMDTFEDIDQVLIVTVEVLKFNYGKLLSGKGFTGFLNASMALSSSPRE